MDDEDYLSPDSPPIGDEATFASLLDEMVALSAPRLFALVQEYGDRVDGWIAAWGLAFEDHVDLLDTDARGRVSVQSLDRAKALYGLEPDISTRVIWWGPDTASRDGGPIAAPPTL